MSDTRKHLGDGIVVDFDGAHIILSSVDDNGVTSQIYLEPEVVAALLDYIENVAQLPIPRSGGGENRAQ